MSQPEDDYDMLNSAVSNGDPFTIVQTSSTSTSGISKYFVPPPGYDWEGQAETVRREREERGGLLVERVVESFGLDDFQYPPTSYSDFQSLISAIQSSSVPRHDRDSLLYYLLLDIHGHGSTAAGSPSQGKDMLQSFVRGRGLPAWRVELIDGLWDGDHGYWDEAIRHLTNPSIPIEPYIPILLTQLQTLPSTESSALTLKLINYTQTPLATDEMRAVYVRALAENDFADAWCWVRNEDWKEGLREEVGELDDEEKHEERKKLIRILVEFCVMPQPRRRPLESLLTLPIDSVEHHILTSYLLNAPADIPTSSYELLHDLLNLRLMSHGEYAAAIDLDKRVDSLNRVRDSDLTRERRDMIQDMVGLLPDVQRKMLSMDVVDAGIKEGGKPNGIHEDLEMSWEPVTASTSTLKEIRQPTPRRNVPLSASEVLRTSSTPNIAIYQALMQSHPASPVPGRFSPAVPPTSRPFVSKESQRSLVLAQGSPQAEALSPYGSPRRSQHEPDLPRGLRNVSSSNALFRQVATAHMNAAAPARDSGSPGPSRSTLHEEHDTMERPSRRFRTLGAWGNPEEATPKAMAKELYDQEDAEMLDEGQLHENDQISHIEEGSTVPGSYEWAAPVKQPQPRKKKASDPTPREEAPKRTRRTRASTQPISPPKAVRKTPRRAAKSKVEEMASIPGTFPDAHREESAGEPVEEEPPAARTRHARSMSRSETRPAPPTDDETKANRRPKRPRGGPPPAPSTNARRTTRGQSVISSVASELGDETVMSGLRRSTRLSSAAPTSPSMSERSDVPMRTRRQVREASETPRKPMSSSGVRTRRQAGSKA